jgi:Mn-dependent DtxR family transcriptional regulator
MSQKKITKEEQFLLALLNEASKTDLSSPINVLPIIKELGFSERQATHAINILASVNFLIKRNGPLVELTEHGRRTAIEIKEDLFQS